MTKDKIQCTVAIITYNSGRTLRFALDSVKDFAEIIICDGGSTDDTLLIAKEYGAVVIYDDPAFKDKDGKLINYAGVRNQTLKKSTYQWFFYIDSDEYITKDLAKEIGYKIASRDPVAFWVPRLYVIDGEIIKCASTYPNVQMRLFHKESVTGFVKEAHERIDPKKDAKISRLSNYMMVPMDSIEDLRKRWDNAIKIEILRRQPITKKQCLHTSIKPILISVLYFLRFIRNILFCRGKHMPIVYEWERHVYHFKLILGLWKSAK